MGKLDKLIKKHKIYYTNWNDNSRRRLDKNHFRLYSFVFDYFTARGGNDEYLKLNENVKTFSDYKPLPLSVPLELEEELTSLLGKHRKEITVYYNGKRPLAKLSFKVKFSTESGKELKAE